MKFKISKVQSFMIFEVIRLVDVSTVLFLKILHRPVISSPLPNSPLHEFKITSEFKIFCIPLILINYVTKWRLSQKITNKCTTGCKTTGPIPSHIRQRQLITNGKSRIFLLNIPNILMAVSVT